MLLRCTADERGTRHLVSDAHSDWYELARKCDWDLSYVDERDVFPAEVSGEPWLPGASWRGWDEPYRTSFHDYLTAQQAKESGIEALRSVLATHDERARIDRGWNAAVKLHSATLPLAEFAAVIGNLRAARFGRDSAWRSTSLLGALDELRHTQIPLKIAHQLVASDPQFDWAHRLLHTDDWVAIAARHMVDELLVAADAVEFAIATHFVFETGFTNLQFVGLTALARRVGDPLIEHMLHSIQTDEARHAQIGGAVLEQIVAADPERAQRLVDKWFWRSWQLFGIVTGFAMDYLAPLAARQRSFREFVQEWIVEQFDRSLRAYGLRRPWYWDEFVAALGNYHHMVYAAAYTHRASVWFDLAMPGPDERSWLAAKYPDTWAAYDAIWSCVDDRWSSAGPGVEWYTHGATPIGFCELCQFVLAGGSPEANSARVVVDDGGRTRMFCSAPCQWIYEQERERYAEHEGVVARILAGKAPPNLLALLRYFGLDARVWGRDVHGGLHPWRTGAGSTR